MPVHASTVRVSLAWEGKGREGRGREAKGTCYGTGTVPVMFIYPSSLPIIYILSFIETFLLLFFIFILFYFLPLLRYDGMGEGCVWAVFL